MSLAHYSRSVAGKADVTTHLTHRRAELDDAFIAWTDLSLSAEDRTAILHRYLDSADLGAVRRVGSGNSVLVRSHHAGASRPTVLILGRHAVSDLRSAGDPQISDPNVLRGPGVGSRLAPTVAFVEGVLAARKASEADPINIDVLSIGEGDDFTSIAQTMFTGNIDAAFLTDSIAWSPYQPAVTTGSRGQVIAELRLTAGPPTHDYTTAGAFRNPLTTLTQALGALRDDRGRIALPGFYDRAVAPDAGARSALAANGHDPDEWALDLDTARPAGKLSSLERASLWPVVSVLGIDFDTTDQASTPGTASATVAFYLVPDQRHAEIESKLRAWFTAVVPEDLSPSIRLLSSTRPYRTAHDSMPVAAQARAAQRLAGRSPIFVPAGGPAGAGEIAFTIGAPVAFAGICGPQQNFGSRNETLPRQLFVNGVAMAAETALQIRH